ncbi:MAG: DUF1573 domain-containing protein [Planctomycetes bacterium]|nr:DUF1573 domain-containing protein [Planctomycetota bacterium]
MKSLKRLLNRAVPALLCSAMLTLTGCSESSSDKSDGATATEPAKTSQVTPTPSDTTPPKIALTAEPVADAKPAAKKVAKRQLGADPAASLDGASPTPGKKRLSDRSLADLSNAVAGTSKVDTAAKRAAAKPAAATPAEAKIVPPAGAPGVVIEPKKLDLGQIPTNDAKSAFVRLVNNGETPRTVLDCKTSCGCTTANCAKGTVLQPGEEMEVEIKLSGGARTTKLNKTVTFIVSDQPPLQLPVSGNAVAFVTMTPDALDPTRNADGKLVLKSIDDQPFTIKSMYPPVIEEFDTTPKSQHELTLSWEKWEELGPRSTKLLFHLDHPKCLKTYGSVSPAAVASRNPAAGPTGRKPPTGGTRPPAVSATPRHDLDQLLSNKKTDDVLALITDGELEINAMDASGQTPLIKAARWGNPDVIEALLDESADISMGDKIGRTPLMYAAQSKNVEAVRVLLDSGANVNDRDQIGNTPLCWGAGFGDAESVKELIEAGSQVDVAGALTGFTPLIWASGFGDAESVRLLVEAGANIEATDVMQGATPLMNAARTGGPENVQMLLEAGASIEARDKDGKTTLLIAASNAGADADMIGLLVEAGADLTAKTNNGEDAYDLARKRTDLRADGVVAALKEAMGKE